MSEEDKIEDDADADVEISDSENVIADETEPKRKVMEARVS